MMETSLDRYNDKELWELISNNDEYAFTFLYESYVDSLFRYGQRITQKIELIEDSIQDLFTKIWINRKQIRIQKSIKFYLFTTFRRDLLLRVKHINKFGDLSSGITNSLQEESYQDFILQQEVAEGKLEILDYSMNHLTKRQKEALHLKYIENQSYEEIAKLMGIQVPTLYNVIFRAIKILKNDFKKYSYKYKIIVLIYYLKDLL
ncbi:RNA polymerase sigma factor [Echinicola sp. 20G]|uniref:RNA polymerase sigma factor n=1 Tax=Echinicola sp. 20G TaxID=2781961 RepID=UPI0019110B14|nr:sigma-70 family RNA polymerase sigma factor [Echinicola sp. 20G]